MSTQSRVLCPETQVLETEGPLVVQSINEAKFQAYNSQLIKPPRVAPINFDYLLYLEPKKCPRSPCVNVDWQMIGPKPFPKPLLIDLQSMTWKQFQALALAHLGTGSDNLHKFLVARNNTNQLSWNTLINGHAMYPVNSAAQITGSFDFLKCASAAYESYPDAVRFKVVMANPCKVVNTREQVSQCQHFGSSHDFSSMLIQSLIAAYPPRGSAAHIKQDSRQNTRPSKLFCWQLNNHC